VTLRRNTADWESRKACASGCCAMLSKMDCSVELFGEKLKMPLILAPVGMGGMTARRGPKCRPSARQTRLAFPSASPPSASVRRKKSATVSDKPFWFQLYMLKDRGIVKEMLDRAWAQGVRTLVFTVDLAVLGTRYRDIRNGMAGGLSVGRLRAGPIDYALHPRWAL
jgi:L-lactate dehydrogenase (cytochrome)